MTYEQIGRRNNWAISKRTGTWRWPWMFWRTWATKAQTDSYRLAWKDTLEQRAFYKRWKSEQSESE